MMNSDNKEQSRLVLCARIFYNQFLTVIKSKYLYIGILAVVAGALMNVASQTYLHNYMSEGKTLPMLSDLVLDNLPVINVALVYDIFCLIPILLLVIYFFLEQDFSRFPFFLVMSGIFYIVRGIFIVLTPFGNPPMFTGSDPLFHGFANYELGVYPSGHAGNVFIMMLLVKDRLYKWLIAGCLIIVIIALFLAHGHYSIDILSGLFFAYAIRSFGEKYLYMFDLSNQKDGILIVKSS